MSGGTNVLETVREDDFVEYFLFPLVDSENEKDQEYLLSALLKKVNDIVKNLSSSYLWHKDPFALSPRTSSSNYLTHLEGQKDHLPPHLYGVSHYGDNIEDEWFMVYILLTITKQIPELIGKIRDVDGEFLLIEAAEVLPNWADPEICENRVYFHEGNLHLISPDDIDDGSLTVDEALKSIRNNPSASMASSEIQGALARKLKGYPDKVKDNLHRATIYVPLGVANILKVRPDLIAPAVQAFCNRDSVDVKVCKAMKYFPPENRVNTSVQFTKCLYAMMLHSKFVPDKRTGWNLPQGQSPQYKAHSLGVKVACGFEILISQAKPSSDVDQDKGWHNYLNSLKNKNYFNGLLEHSKDYNELLNKAKEYYIKHKDSMHYTPAIGQEIMQLTKTLECNAEEFRRNENALPKDDDDSWLNISPADLDKMLQDKYGQKKFVTINNNSDASAFTDNLTKFLNHTSTLDGAEFPNDSPTRPPRKAKNKPKVSFSQETKTTSKESNNKINFDPNSFSCAIQNMLNFSLPEDDSWSLESDSMSEYEDDNYVKVESYDEVKTKMQQVMEEMDRELAKTTIGQSFEKNNDSFDDIENFNPINIDANALKNILESYQSQLGEAGPSSNMLGPMGLIMEGKQNGEE